MSRKKKSSGSDSQDESQGSVCFGAPLHGDVLPKLQWVEVATTFQIPSFQIIGLASPEVAEARDRIRSAIEAIEEKFPRSRVVINLSPASVRKRGTGSDLAMALAILSTLAPNQASFPDRVVAWGELGLDGRVKPLGQLTRSLYATWRAGVKFLMISKEELEPAKNCLELLIGAGAEEGFLEKEGLLGEPPVLVGVSHLAEAWNWVRSFSNARVSALEPSVTREALKPLPAAETPQGLLPLAPALERIVGVAATGEHHLLLLGPKGTGKSHALDWFVALQQDVSSVVRLQAILLEELRTGDAGSPRKDFHPSGRPVRKVGPQVKASALVGCVTAGGIRVGEFSLADGGILIADELPEWSRDSREALREPLERGWVSLNRVHGSVEMPARFRLAANGNLCPCGGWIQGLSGLQDDEEGRGFIPTLCKCPPRVRSGYLARLSGPVLDRVDLLYLSYGKSGKDTGKNTGKNTGFDELLERVERGRQRGRSRWGVPAGLLSAEEVEGLLRENSTWKEKLNQISISSLRSRHKTLRNALSLAAYDGEDEPSEAHFFEAACYRPERYGLA